MRVSSISSNRVRVAPQQERSTKRLAGFLDAAAGLFVSEGYEATTMTAIAERSGSSIGALYNYFPDKQSLAFTLVNQYALKLEELWKPVIEKAGTVPHTEFANLFIETITGFVQEHPAYLSLISAPVKFRREPAARKASRLMIAKAFRAKNPALSEQQAIVSAYMALQIVKGMMALYTEAPPGTRDIVVNESKKLLTIYLGTFL